MSYKTLTLTTEQAKILKATVWDALDSSMTHGIHENLLDEVLQKLNDIVPNEPIEDEVYVGNMDQVGFIDN